VNYALASLVNTVFQVLRFLILIEVIGSWVVVAGVRLPAWAYDVLNAIQSITRPVMAPIRRMMPSLGGLDLSPLIALLLLELLRGVIVTALLTARF
jgi:YggT family protein